MISSCPKIRAAFTSLHELVLRGESGILEFEVIGLNGGRRLLETHAASLRGASGEGSMLLGITRDLTGRKKIEEEIRETKNFLASIFDNIPDSIFIKDAKHLRFTRVNTACEKLTGYSEKELIGKSDYDFFPKDQADFFVAQDRETLEGRKRISVVEETITSRDGTDKLLVVSAPARRLLVRSMQAGGMSERGALRVIGMSASALRYEPAPGRNGELRERKTGNRWSAPWSPTKSGRWISCSIELRTHVY